MLHPRALIRPLGVVLLLAMAVPAPAQDGASARAAYQTLLSRERALTANARVPAPGQVRTLVEQYVRFATRYARTGYADNALWQAARLAGMLGDRLRREGDRATSRRLLKQLIAGYPSSSLVQEARAALRDLSAPLPTRTAAARPATRSPAPAVKAHPEPVARAPQEVAGSPRPTMDAPEDAPAGSAAVPATLLSTRPATAVVREIRRAVLPEVVRVTIEVSQEVSYRDERLASPARVFFDLDATSPGAELADAVLSYPDDVVREIRVGQRVNEKTRVVLDLEDAERYSVFTLYNPYRLVIDVHRKADARKPTQASAPAPAVARDEDGDPTTSGGARTARATDPLPARPRAGASPAIPSTEAAPLDTPELPDLHVPAAPSVNSSGSFSIARQLGLNVSRIVIDPGHGGHDPGALGKKVTEAEIVLDVALRLEKLLRKHPVFDVVLTRRTDVFIPLEQRTAIANRTRADLFLSIHANASRNAQARGVETYFLNFATNPEAEAVAARENAASDRPMRELGDIVRAIALNNKLDESREFAGIIQASLARRLRSEDSAVRDLGVKQAPFVVLIGAGMPSVLAEISFVTNARDAQLLRSGNHRQKIAESLYEAVLKYQRTLKASETVALQ